MRTEYRHRIRVLPLIIAIIIPILVGGFSAFLTAGDMKGYETMPHPPLSPPGWLFPIVWTILYAVMGIASYLVYASDAEPDYKRKTLLFYAAQLIMNMFWSTLFFTYGLYLLALVWLLIMWVLIIICAFRFYKINRAAGLMMTALFVWTTFAAYLNAGTYILSLK